MNTSPSSSLLIKVTSTLACFRQPQFRDDAITYETMPPITARRIIMAYNPIAGGKWRLRRVTTLMPIDLIWDEILVEGEMKRGLLLRNVSYLIKGELKKVSGNRSLRDPANTYVHLGLPHWRAHVEVLDTANDVVSSYSGSGAIDLGWMLYDLETGRPRYFRAVMTNGTIEFKPPGGLTLVS